MNKEGWFVSIGSNIDPEVNVVRIVEKLIGIFDKLHISPLAFTQPVNIDTEKVFINGVVFIESDEDAASLKSSLQGIEVAMGRPLDDAQRKIKDRSVDLDILCRYEAGDEARVVEQIPRESYIRPLFILLAMKLNLLKTCRVKLCGPTVTLLIDGSLFGKLLPPSTGTVTPVV